MRRVWFIWFSALLIPYCITIVWAGQIQGEVKEHTISSGKTVILERKEGNRILDIEEYLIGMLALQIPPEYGIEALKAQAIVDRTYLYQILDGRTEIKEEELDTDYMEWSQMIEEWGQLMAAEHYQTFRKAVSSTAATIMKYEGEYVRPLFHKISAGKTRTGDQNLFPYLLGTDSKRDVEAEEYLHIIVLSENEFDKKIADILSDKENCSGVFDTVQIIKRDDAGYIEQMQIAGNTYTGEEVQYTLGLPSSCFFLTREEEGKIRIVVKGVGHGYGMSQYGAKVMAEDGWKAEDILKYYYQNIVLIFE